MIKLAIIERHGLKVGMRLYLEDSDEPVDEGRLVGDHAGPTGIKIHLHRCRYIGATINFNGDTVRHRFGPGTTVARAKNWAAERNFGMTPLEAGEHALQISGTQERPAPGVHLGALASCPACSIAFDLVPHELANGACKTSVCLPDERAFRADIGKPACLFASAQDRWRVVKIAWPFVFFAVAAADGREFVLRLDCSGYPHEAPTGGLWDPLAGRRPAVRPLAAQQWRPGRRCISSRLERRHRALPAMRPPERRRHEPLAPSAAGANLAAGSRHQPIFGAGQ